MAQDCPPNFILYIVYNTAKITLTIEHVTIKESNAVLYEGVISEEKWGSQRTLQVKIKGL